MFPAQHPTADRALAALESMFREMGAAIVCYSGGVDSALMLAIATRALGDKAIGMTAVSPSLARADLDDATSLAERIGAVHRLVESHEIDDPSYQRNAPDRCFHCKSELYSIAEKKRAEWGVEHVVNGTNVDDLGDYRPGLEAAKNAGVRSPLVELGLGKAAVREIAALLDLPVWDRPASACLSSRIPFGTTVTPERLSMIERFEAGLRTLGFRQLRVRYHVLPGPDPLRGGGGGGGAPSDDGRSELASGPEGGALRNRASLRASTDEIAFARVEVGAAELARAASPEIAPRIDAMGRDIGFAYVTLDLGGYRMGSHNEVLKRRLSVVS
ncbi:MAG: ATP-dependent sacrificial sulfur transferase LarE [Polyangiaceae bacterium]